MADNGPILATGAAALAGTTLVLGAVYWLLRERDDRLARGDRSQPPAQ